MNRFYKGVLSLLIVFLPMVVSGQSILLEGRVVDKEELTPVPFSHIVKNEKTVGVTPSHAEFSLMVSPYDTLVISHIGYKKHVFVVPEDAPVRLDTILFMTKDTTLLQEVRIHGFPTEREFKRQMMATDGLTRELIHAQNNVYQSQQLYKYGVVPKMDALDNYKTFTNGPQPVVFFAANSTMGLGAALKKAFTSQRMTFLPKRSTPLLKDVKLVKEVTKDSAVHEKVVVNTQEEKK